MPNCPPDSFLALEIPLSVRHLHFGSLQMKFVTLIFTVCASQELSYQQCIEYCKHEIHRCPSKCRGGDATQNGICLSGCYDGGSKCLSICERDKPTSNPTGPTSNPTEPASNSAIKFTYSLWWKIIVSALI